ncbi:MULTISPECIES: flavodoxin [Tenacibaculum]|uniref:Flavodoxin n=1 Tax=Tenacibaculum mesophilum TaxID=104268 RepID=A0ABM7CCI9_9FLAO|nr:MULTISPECIES: flavodoxin [Tenacibaculum]GFD83123.1 flavodoxin [Tenacibaculum sp. KUL118]GFD93198.1 flavodoxin [Alteromonas sp. KUL154]GFD98265.1 flavodoxin [Alteromonas sp. KUL156]AZJ31457.1 flavodoxin [Tenacibaculum mesophilum]MCG7502133.1 flavodoxin [Tenacibaculum sp. Mcav3-52]
MNRIGLIYGSDTGMTEEIVSSIVDDWQASEIEVIEVSNMKKEDYNRFDKFILGLSTWYDGDLQSDWETYYENEFQTIDFTGKKVAIFGLGDQYGYGEYFVDGVGILAKNVVKNGGELIGKWSCKEYDFEESKAQIEEDKDYFYGLALDEDNEPEKTPDRLANWLNQIEKEFDL